jgi:hypothetical protein
MSTINDAVLNRELRKIFSQKGFDINSETVKTIRAKLCKSLGLQKFPSEQKATLNELIKRILNEKEEQEDEKDSSPKKRHLKGKAIRKVQESEDEEEEDEGSNNEVSEEEEEEIFKQKKKKKIAFRPKEEKKMAPESSSLPYSADVKSLLELGTAMRMGPNLHRGLKSMDNSERMEVLTERLKMAGASWKGKIPSKTDVLRAKQKRQRQDDLDGLDPSVILETTGHRRGRAVVSYVSYADDKEEEEEDKEEEEEEEEEEEVELKKTKKKSKKKGSDDDDDDDRDFDGESSSENEFDE